MLQKVITPLFAIFFICIAYSQNNINVSKAPSWINYQDYNENPEVDEEEITQGELMLLADYQTNIPKQEVYYRFVSKITDNNGIQSNSNISAVYDPQYQKLTFHTINIIRDGDIINKLNPDHFQVIRRELNAENHLYDGSLSAMLNMSDVRNGDIIDYSYTIKGFNPIHKGKFSNSFILNDYVPIGKINVSIFTNRQLYYKPFNTSLEPNISTQNGYTNYNWMVESPVHFTYEENIPSWKILMPTIFISEFASWEEVVKWATSIYTQNVQLDAALKIKVNEISANHKTEGEKIKAVLDFVQNEVRYLGLEYGISSYKPNSPNKVFEQRYGDCKDKSLLMVHMLKELNVEAYPMLLNTSLKGTITQLPPSPSFFDHCVVKVIDKREREFYYDPTITNQGGTYKNTHFPNYEYGLVIKENNVAFDTIRSYFDNKITTLEEFVIKEINGSATLNVTSTYTDVEANRMRDFFKNNSKSSIIKEFENYYANYYSKVKILTEPEISDNLATNEFTVTESYVIDSIWEPMKLKPGFIGVEFSPHTFSDMLYVTNLENRKNEIQLPYPVSREHNINIVLPSTWQIEKYNDLVSNDIFYYESSAAYGKRKNEIKLKSYLKIQKPSVRAEEFETYYNDLNELEESFGYSIYIPTNASDTTETTTSFSLAKMFSWFLVIGVIIVFIVWVFTRNRKANI